MNNPFTPAFGGKPQHFFGRHLELDLVKHALADSNNPYRSLFITGNRGCGKTALLEQCSLLAHDAGWTCVDVHSSHAAASIVRSLTKATEQTEQTEIAPQLMGVSLGHASTSRTIAYDELDLVEVLVKCCASLPQGKGVFITVDEIQKIPASNMEGICAAVQMAMRKGYSVMLVLAGLPGAKEKISSYQGCTFMQRAYEIKLGSLFIDETYDAFEHMLALSGIQELDAVTVDELARFSMGYPYLMQLLGFHLIDLACARFYPAQPVLDRALVKEVEPLAYQRYCDDVLMPSTSPLGEKLIAYLNAMCTVMDDDGRSSVRMVSQYLEQKPEQLSVYRDRLIKRRLIRADGYGYLRFNLPHLRRFLNERQREPAVDAKREWLY